MFDSLTLDVIISIVFIFLLYSFLATTILEMIASAFRFRSKLLVWGLYRMLEDDETNVTFGNKVKNFFQFIFLRNLLVRTFKTGSLQEAFFRHPAIKYLARGNTSSPSSITPADFSNTMIDIMVEYGGKWTRLESVQSFIEHDPSVTQNSYKEITINNRTIRIGNDTLKQLKLFFMESGNNLDSFKKLLEQWFNNTMDRVTGWYKAHVQWLLFVIGLGLAIGFNVDIIKIKDILVTNESARSMFKPFVEETYKSWNNESATFTLGDTNKNATDTTYIKALKKIITDVTNANKILGLGWNCKDSTTAKDSLSKKNIKKNETKDCWDLFWGGILGWLITAIAISFGAPFWFDLLNKLVMLRGTVKGEKKKETNT